MGVLLLSPFSNARRARPSTTQRLGARPRVRWTCLSIHAAYGRDPRGSILGCPVRNSVISLLGQVDRKKTKFGSAPPRVPARCDRRRHDAPCMQAKAGRTFGPAVRAGWSARCAFHFVLLIDSVPAHSEVFSDSVSRGARSHGWENKSYTRVCKILHACVSAHQDLTRAWDM